MTCLKGTQTGDKIVEGFVSILNAAQSVLPSLRCRMPLGHSPTDLRISEQGHGSAYLGKSSLILKHNKSSNVMKAIMLSGNEFDSTIILNTTLRV